MSTITSTSAQKRTPGVAWYFFLLALASLMWSCQGVAVKFLDRQMGPISITFLPFYVTTLLFIPLLIRERRRNPLGSKVTWGDWKKFAMAGIGGQVLAQLGMTWGISDSLASNGAILNLLIPVISAVLASFMLREKLTRLRVVALILGLAGVLLLSESDVRQSSFLQTQFLLGNLLIVGGCFGSSFYNVYCKGLLRKFSEVEILIFSYICASIASLPLLFTVEPLHLKTFTALDWKSWLAFGFLAIFMYGASMLVFFKALQHLDVTVASFSLYLVPIFGVLLAITILGERLSPIAIGGAAIVLVSTVLVMRYDSSSA
ncbi:MAG TPA: DMT family transporter [Terriglobia bacterium]|nr:DMT family transporter [Terriglobia bacterium]